MLDTTTKRRIDTARDILVGKVPDPKSQVEQITIALIYKFMDDMDLDAEELGGEPSFFSGEYEKYGWRKIFNPSLGGFEMLSLYSEAILKMAQNPNLPQLFRDIFKNAYLPYRDPETLKSFLKIINDFSYDHSEKLGDAFEYLLSVLGSQGDAGQFRTPRHVIDFMTALIAPKKNETVLDPACGTAGFLISAYKHILKENSSNYDKTDPYTFEQNNVKLAEITVNGKHYKGDKLSPDDRARIIQNIKGYDISPDMVRLSLVNLYLHGFTDPHIHEYDTLTSEERWNEFYDIILANPPFMSPKGGIRPHKRFAVQSKRSEVLFVDYMAEHLTPTGKAAIIVPEGIIFQSGTAYKSLRKMLVEDNYLVGVISLPAGVFNPYSGVKTSILWLDKSLAKKTDKILFAKIENDGFDLGAQRRPIKQNDLPGVFRKLTEYRDKLMLGEDVDFENEPLISIVKKEKVIVNEDYNLSQQRYQDFENRVTSYDTAELKDLVLTMQQGINTAGDKVVFVSSGYPIIQARNMTTETINFDNPKYLSEKDWLKYKGKHKPNIGDILFSNIGTIGKSVVVERDENYLIHWNIFKITVDKSKILPHYLKTYLGYLTSINYWDNFQKGGTVKFVNKKILNSIEIPVPPLSVQEEIVAEIESYQKIIDGACQVVENYKPKIDIDPEWEMVGLSKICDINKETVIPSDLYSDWFNYLDISTVENGTGKINYDNVVKVEDAPSRARRLVQQHDILLSTVRPNLKAFGYVDVQPNRFIASTGFAILTANKDIIEPRFLYFMVFQESVLNQMINRMGKGSYPSINQKDVSELQIALPSMEVQKEIISQLEIEQKSIFYNEKLIEIYEQKIKDRIAKVWGE
jgi:type I restriction enzyme M protein